MDGLPVPQNTQKVLRVQLLGGFSVSIDSLIIPEAQWKSHRVRNLVKLLALTPAHRLHRDQVIDILWPDSDLDAAANNFHQTLYAARRVLEPAGAGTLKLEDGFLSFSGGENQALWVDIEQFEEAAARAKGSQDPVVYQAALVFYPGDLLPDDLYEEWTIQRRAALRQIHLNLLLDLARLFESRQEYSRAIEMLLSLLSDDKSNEEAHAQLMRLYALSGQRLQALRQYQVLREALHTDLEIEPSETTAQLYEAIQSNRYPPAAVSTPSLPAAVEYLHNLPAQLTSFIGHEQEIVEVCQQLRQQRLVTLTGSGGTGKTRLALHVAQDLLNGFPDGVWFMDLAPVTESESLAQKITSTLKLQIDTADSHLTTLLNYLRDKKLLLLLDNCEHLLDACAQLTTQLLQQCPHITVLTTSREVLSIAGEIAYRVPSLAASDPDQLTSPIELAQVESVRLFAERAAAVLSGFSLSTETLPYVARICYRLDGIPLAIELAAARVGVLSVEQIASRLDDRFRLLTGGSRTALPRQRTLRASIDWSYSLLSEPERLLFQRVSVFSGGWSLPAVEVVCSGDDLRQDEILDALAGLVNKSLVAADLRSAAETRYSMLETIRQYAQDRLEDTGQAAAMRERHLAYFLALAKEYEPQLRTPKIFELLDRLDAELDNLRGALVWALGRGDRSGAEQASAILTSLFYFWLLRSSLFTEVNTWFIAAFSLLPENDPSAIDLKAWSLLILAILEFQFHLFQEPLDHLNQCIALFRQAENRPGNRQKLSLALAERKHIIHEFLFFFPPDPSIHAEDARRDGNESVAIARDLLLAGEPVADWFVSWIYFKNALAETFPISSHTLDPLGKDRIHALLQSAYEISLRLGDKVSELYILEILATNDRPADPLYLKEGIDLAKRLGNKHVLVDFLGQQGHLAYLSGQFHEMEENFHEILMIARQAGLEGGEIWSTRLAGIASIYQADIAKAQSYLATALDLSIAQQDEYGILAEINDFVGLALLVQQNQPAARLLGFVECQLESFFKPLDELDQIEFKRHTTRAKEELGATAFAALWAEGRSLTMEQALLIARTMTENTENKTLPA